jgi:hypothetical protein
MLGSPENCRSGGPAIAFSGICRQPFGEKTEGEGHDFCKRDQGCGPRFNHRFGRRLWHITVGRAGGSADVAHVAAANRARDRRFKPGRSPDEQG